MLIVLSLAEIKGLYNAGTGSTYDAATTKTGLPGTINTDLMGYWNANAASGDLIDSVNRVGTSGSSDHDLNEIGTVARTVSGKISGGVICNTTTGNRFSLNNSEDFECGTDDFAFWCWVNISSYVNGLLVDMFNSSTTQAGWGLMPYSNGRLYYYFNTLGNGHTSNSWTGFETYTNTDEWHLLIFNVSRSVGSGANADGDGKMSIYMDGNNFKHGTDITAHSGTGITFTDNQFCKNADAIMDEMGWMIGDRLTGAEMDALYNSDKGVTYI